MAQILKGTTYTSGGTVTDANLNNLVDNATLQADAIDAQTDRPVLATSDTFLVTSGATLKKVTLANLLKVSPIIGGTSPAAVTATTLASTTLTTSGLATVGTLTSTGLATAGSLSVGGTSAHTGAATFASTAAFTGAATFDGSATFNGAVSGVIPAGTVVCRASANVPTGWLACNGQLVNRATYANLFADIAVAFGAGDGSTTFGLPDLRGEFVRGADAGRGIDSGRVLGSAQAGAVISHSHFAFSTEGVSANSISDNPAAYAASSMSMSGTYYSQYAISESSLTPSVGPTSLFGSTETRPRNIALSYIIKT